MSKKSLVAVLAVVVIAGVVLLIGSRRTHITSTTAAPNILLISLDTTRADHLGCYGYQEALTPSLNGLASNGVVFDQAFSNVPMTLPSHATVMTGLLPPEHGIRVNGEQRLDLDKPTLAEILRGRGYQTGAFIAAVVLDHVNGLDRGFDVYHDEVAEIYKKSVYEPLSAYRPGDEVANDALSWLGSRDRQRPFFCWVHLFDPHTPYFHHEALRGTRYEGQASYDGEVAFMDIQVGRLIAFLEKEGLTKNTLVIAFGDHGEGLGEHGEEAHGHMLYNTTLHVPLVFSQPGRIQQGTRVGSLVSLVDLFGTVLDLVGGGEAEERSGRSVAGAVFGKEIPSVASYGETQLPFSSFNWSPLWSYTTPEWKYIRSARVQLYDRPVDPRELNNLAAAQRPKVEELEKDLKGLESEMVLHSAGQVEMTAETIKRLEALGYIAGGHQNFDAQTIDYSSLHDIEDMLPVLAQIPKLRAMGRDGKSSEELISALRDIIKITPESPSFHATLVSNLVKAGRAGEALPEALEVIKLKPNDHEMCQTVATTYLYLGKPVEAVPYFWQAIRLKPEFAPAHEELAKVLRNNGETEAADRHSAENRAKLKAEAAEPFELGVVLAGHQRVEEALQKFAEALKAAPDDALIHAGLARVLEQKGDYAAAAREFAEAVRLDPADPQKLGDLGKVLGKGGQYAEAAEYLAKFLDLKPDDVPARTNLALVLARQGKLDDAMKQFAEALRIAPDDGQIHLTKAGVLEENGRMPEAVAEYREAVRLSPERQDWANHLARILATHADATIRNGAEAVKLAEIACTGPGEKNAGYLDTLASAYAEAGRFEEAVAAGRKAVAAAKEAQKAELAAEIQQRLELYQKNQPYHMKPQ